MAKHRLELTPRKEATRPWLLAALVLGLGVSLGWADQISPTTPRAGIRTAQPPGQKPTARPAPVTPAAPVRTPAVTPAKPRSPSGSTWTEGRHEPSRPKTVQTPLQKTEQQTEQRTGRFSPARPARTPAERPVNPRTSTPAEVAGRRDPFRLPSYMTAKGGGSENVMESEPGGVLPPGKRGLVISHLLLQGVVREQTSNKMIAVVTNETKVARFLYENDALYNGVVSKITPDAVYFKENVLDAKGRVTTREVVKRLGSAPGEGR